MDIRNKRVLVFGGWGLVGSAICRELITQEPSSLVICSLSESEAEDAVKQIHLEFPNTSTKIAAESGNIFVRWDLRYASRDQLLNEAEKRRVLISDVINPLDDDILKNSFIYTVIDRHRPDIIIDAVNSATALAYQDIYSSSRDVLQGMDAFESDKDFQALRSTVEKNLCTSYVPQLIRHVQILYNAMTEMNTSIYIKIGTSGTGGMGLNIPYTHSEERPSRVLLAKSSLAGAHSLLLFLMARTPEGPIIKEFKPTAAIAWKSIQHGPIIKRGKPIMLHDMPPEMAVELKDTFHIPPTPELREYFDKQEEKPLEAVFIDSGENGTFSRSEFEALTSIGQMEYITPEEIASSVIYEIRGGNTGHDIVNALDEASMGPTYRAGAMRGAAIEKLVALEREHDQTAVAFEMLGPPRLSKLLYEAHIIKKIATSVDSALNMEAADLSRKAEELIKGNAELRSRILSIGIPILMADGKRMLRGREVKIPPRRGDDVLAMNEETKDLWAMDGWVDLRIANFLTWQQRFRTIMEELKKIPYNDTSSRYTFDNSYWEPSAPIDEGKAVAWIFRVEEHGARMKS